MPAVREPARDSELPQAPLICLSCAARLPEERRFYGSLRCARCRAKGSPLDPDLTAHWRAAGAHF